MNNLTEEAFTETVKSAMKDSLRAVKKRMRSRMEERSGDDIDDLINMLNCLSIIEQADKMLKYLEEKTCGR